MLSRFNAGAFAFPFAVAVAIALIFISESSYQVSRGSIDRLNEINTNRLRLQSLITLLVDAETGQRGYLLTESTDYLRPYGDALESIAALRAPLEAYYASRAGDTLATLRELIDNKIAELATTVRLAETGQREAALELVRANFGKEQMDAIRGIGEQLLAEEANRREAARTDVYDMLMLNRIGVGTMTVLALIALLMYLRQTRALEAQRGEQQRAVQAERDQLESQVLRRTAQLAELTRHLQTAREDERGRIARELHDELGALLTAAKLDVARIKTRIAALSPEANERIAHLNQTLNSGIALKRRIIEDLRPSSLANLGLVAALENLTRDFAARSGLDVRADLHDVELAPSGQLTAYRLVQEALTNVAKYAKARTVVVLLAPHSGGALVEVRDDGVGFEPRAAAPSTHGLLGMRYRVEGEGGALHIESAPGRGASVRASLPGASDAPAIERRRAERLAGDVARA